MARSMERVIYKILTLEADAQLAHDGVLTPYGIDAEDGFVHFSTAMQLADTLDKHYACHADLMILAVNAEACGAALRWESARGGDLFPHLYAPFTAAHVVARLSLNGTRDGLDAFLNGVG